MAQRKRRTYDQEQQLSLFEEVKPHELYTNQGHAQQGRADQPPPSPLEFVRARFEKTENMTPEEYKKWVRFLVNWSVRNSD